MMQRCPSPCFPSQNSAFLPTSSSARPDIEPSSKLCKKIKFGNTGNKAELGRSRITETIYNNRDAFAKRWNCDCDLMLKRPGCTTVRVEKVKNKNTPRFDWIPISAGTNKDGFLNGFDKTDIRVLQRPESPVPFLPPATRTRLSSTCTLNRFSPLILDGGKVALPRKSSTRISTINDSPEKVFEPINNNESLIDNDQDLLEDHRRSCLTPPLSPQDFQGVLSSKQVNERQLLISDVFPVKRIRRRKSLQVDIDDVNGLKPKTESQEN